MDLVVAYKLSIVNSYFTKKEEHLMTFNIGNTRTQIDYFLIRVGNRRWCKDCKVMLGWCLIMQHRLLLMDVEFKSLKRRKKSIGDFRAVESY